MEFNVVFLLCLLSSIMWATSESVGLAPELYWKSKLPNVPIPQVIKNLLPNSTEYNANFEINGMPIKDHNWDIYLSPWKGLDASLHKNPEYFFFVEHDLRKNKQMFLDLQDTFANRFLPREVTESIPFSINHFPETLNRFSLTPDSPEAKVLKKTLERCEKIHDIAGEDTTCVTSLESMVDYVETEMGNKVEMILSTEKAKGEYRVQDYRVGGDVRMVVSSKVGGNPKNIVTCHKMNYAYTVFKCHKTKNTRVYTLPLVGEDGSEVKAVAICHIDTSKWNPRHYAFLALGVKRGTVPICHFLTENDVIWLN